MHNWKEYVADTDPTCAESFFRINAFDPGPPATVMMEPLSPNRLYTLQRAASWTVHRRRAVLFGARCTVQFTALGVFRLEINSDPRVREAQFSLLSFALHLAAVRHVGVRRGEIPVAEVGRHQGEPPVDVGVPLRDAE